MLQEEEKPPVTPFSLSFNKKRLCERWLDNLFMVLYEDLRAYTIWRADMAHHKKQDIVYHRTSHDWEALGDLAFRLFRMDEAKDAYMRVVESGRFSAHAVTRLLDMYVAENNLPKTVEMMVYLAKYNDKMFNDVIVSFSHLWQFPVSITHRLNQLIREHGLSKVNNTLISDPMISVPSQKLVQKYMGYAQVFAVQGWNE